MFKKCWKKQTRKQKKVRAEVWDGCKQASPSPGKKTHTHEMLRGHDLWSMTKCERTRAWCRRCAGRKFGKLLMKICRGQTEPERDRNKAKNRIATSQEGV